MLHLKCVCQLTDPPQAIHWLAGLGVQYPSYGFSLTLSAIFRVLSRMLYTPNDVALHFAPINFRVQLFV